MVQDKTAKNVWRLIDVESYDAFMNMAIDEAVFRARIEELVPDTLRLYRWGRSAVSAGRFQRVENEIQLNNCKRLDVDVVRRITGGGTVYHDAEREITYSVVADKRELGTEDVGAIYARIYSGLAEALRILGVVADFSEGDAKNCPNLTAKGKKISGSAQAHRKGVVLQHGTLLVDIDLEEMFSLLRVPWAKTGMEAVGVARDKITSVSRELGRNVSANEVTRALANGFEKALGIKFIEGELCTYERKLAEKLCRYKYATEEWNMRGLDVHSP